MALAAEVLLLAGLAVFVGAVVQGVVGFGLALVVAPVFALLDPTLVPGAVLLVVVLLPVLALAREHRAVDWRGLRFALVGRLPGTVVGAWAVAVLSPRALGVIVGLVVLAAVATSAVSWSPPPTPRVLLVAGFVSGVAGTATSVGGPPMALVYSRASGPRVRATLSAFFVVGSVLSLGALALAGAVSRRDVLVALSMLPFLGLGFAVSGPLRHHVDRGGVRPAVLALCAASAVVLLARSLA